MGGGAKATVHGLGENPAFGVFCPKLDGSSSTETSILLEQGMPMQKNSRAGIYHKKKKKPKKKKPGLTGQVCFTLEI